MPIPIPARSRSTTKSNPSVIRTASTKTVSRAGSRGDNEPASLVQPAGSRAIRSTSATPVTTNSRLRNTATAKETDICDFPVNDHAATLRSSNQLPHDNTNAGRNDQSVSGEVNAKITSRLPRVPSISRAATDRDPEPKLHKTAQVAAMRRPQNTKTSRRPGYPPSHSDPSRAASSIKAKSSLSVSDTVSASSGTTPSFTTYHQQYSPKKGDNKSSTSVPKPTTVRADSVNHITWSAELGKLRDECLQLRLLHEKSEHNLWSLRSSIKSQLHDGYEHLQNNLNALELMQYARQADVNALALSEWLEKDKEQHSHNGKNIVDTTRLLVFAHCLNELQEVSKKDGPLERGRRIFDEWSTYSSSGRSNRIAGNTLLDEGNAQGGRFALDPSSHAAASQWLSLLSSVEDRLAACMRSLDGLGRPSEASSTGKLLSVSAILVWQVLQEIKMCKTIEGLMLREEQEWMSRTVEEALQATELHHGVEIDPASARRGIWQRNVNMEAASSFDRILP